MPQPRTSVALALLAALAAGAPLPYLTRRQAPAVSATEETHTAPCFMELRFSGRPQSIRLLHRGRELARLPENSPSPWMDTLPLPKDETLELEVEALWEPTNSPQAISLQLEPDGRPARTETRWSEEGGSRLHDIFFFQW